MVVGGCYLIILCAQNLGPTSSVGWFGLILHVIGRGTNQEIGEIVPRFRTVEHKVAVQHVIQLFHELVVMKSSSKLDGVFTHNFAGVVEHLEGVLNQTIGAARYADNQAELAEIDFRYALNRRRERDDAVSSGLKSQ